MLSPIVNQSLRGLLLNGDFIVNQFRTIPVTAVAGATDIDVADMFKYSHQTSTGTMEINHVGAGPGGNGGNLVRLEVGTAQAVLGANDFSLFYSQIEGQVLRENNGVDRKYVAVFSARSLNGPITLPVSMRAYDGTNVIASYNKNVLIGTTLERHAIEIPRQLIVTPHLGSGRGLEFGMVLASGSNFNIPSQDTWTAGLFVGNATADNFLADAANGIEITRVQVYPIDLVTSDLLKSIEFNYLAPKLRGVDNRVERYFYNNRFPNARSGLADGITKFTNTGSYWTTNAGSETYEFPVEMRVNPSMVFFDDAGTPNTVTTIGPGGAPTNGQALQLPTNGQKTRYSFALNGSPTGVSGYRFTFEANAKLV